LSILIPVPTAGVFDKRDKNCALYKETRLAYRTKHSCLGTTVNT